jgi:glutathione S-transferase
MYELFITNKNYSSWSLRAWVLMRQLELPFREQLVPVVEGSNWDAFRTFSPSGRVPCLRDGDTIVWDTMGITEYLAERHAGVWPADPKARTWARCAAAEMHAGFGTLRERCTMNVGLRIRLRDVPPLLARDIARISELWNEGLARFGGPFLAGEDFTAVDAFFAPVAFRIQTYGLSLAETERGPEHRAKPEAPDQRSEGSAESDGRGGRMKYGLLDETAAAYAARLLALPAMHRWYTDALAETWREPGHEAEAEVAGVWLEDLRAQA